MKLQSLVTQIGSSVPLDAHYVVNRPLLLEQGKRRNSADNLSSEHSREVESSSPSWALLSPQRARIHTSPAAEDRLDRMGLSPGDGTAAVHPVQWQERLRSSREAPPSPAATLRPSFKPPGSADTSPLGSATFLRRSTRGQML